MENNNETNNEVQEQTVEQLTSTDAIIGVLSSPGETFETIAATKKKNYWLLSVLISIIISIVVTFVFFRDEQLISGMMDKQKAQLEKSMEEKVKSGKMSPEQSSQAIEQAEKFMDPKGVFFQIIGYGGSVVIPFLMLFVLSLVYLLITKILKANVDFGNLMNVVGLPLIIGAIGSIVALVISVVIGKMSSPSLALFLTDEVIGTKLSELLFKIDIFSIWYYVAVAIGLSKITRISAGKAYVTVFGVWILWLIVTTVSGYIFG